MTEELNGRRIVVPETRELGQLVRMLEERGAEAIPCPMIAIRDAPDAEPVAAWLRWFVKGTCDDLVLMTGEGLRRLLGLARRIDLEPAFLDALRTTRKITRGPKPVRALREIGLDADIPADEPTTEGIIAAMRRLDLSGRSVGIQQVGLADRVAAVGGDFFVDPLPKADVITMGMILHDWNLEKKKTLIRKAYDALPQGGAFVVIEALIDDARRDNAFGLLMSLNMLIEFGDAFDYSGSDFAGWCREAGFHHFEIIPLTGPSSAAVAYK
jgi:hypothetical protein